MNFFTSFLITLENSELQLESKVFVRYETVFNENKKVGFVPESILNPDFFKVSSEPRNKTVVSLFFGCSKS